jgi:hypothetical protein
VLPIIKDKLDRQIFAGIQTKLLWSSWVSEGEGLEQTSNS